MKAFAVIVFTILFSWAFSIEGVNGQTSHSQLADSNVLPKVFMLGEQGQLYENIMPGYQTLLDACDGDMVVAFQKLHSMMKEMEAYADLLEYDLKGVNAWMHFFWAEDGSIDHIGFHLKPNSKNVDTKELELFLKNFAFQYKFPLVANVQYSLYSTFSFPVF